MRAAIGLVLFLSLASVTLAARSAAFREVSLEARCPALASEVQELADAKLGSGRYRELGCAEGNGLGGARYSLDFKVSKENGTWRSFRLEAAYDDKGAPLVRFCDTGRTPSDCSPAAAKAFAEMGKGAQEVLATLSGWLTAKPSSRRIFDRPYAEFVQGVVAAESAYPIKGDGASGTVKLRLTPTSASKPESGRVSFTGEVDQAFLACFACKSVGCLNQEVRYKFADRFLSLVREDKVSGKTFGAGWIIEGKDVASWSYVCGVSRYSLQNVK